ncbi:hypothetical protein JR316_0007311 [Psilocybe cubensis]|uniref:Uncharacterized protein n=2 Tax=Psilocybe cubensis TaxID=181762 RepID=A0ACB8GYK7_PSICU|nr:hypothetical protein JR316_0007311 [Psilocybe cubensis]KAH9480711.1 hypothetical protein JR316_0007311 [Psilocybe cubensis]
MNKHFDAKMETNFSGKGWKYQNIPSFSPIQRALPRVLQSNLTHIDLNSDFLLVPPTSAWTFEMLRSSPIVTLTVSIRGRIQKEEFTSYVFPAIAASVPGLQSLRITFLDDDFLTVVVDNLYRLPLLRKMVVGLSFSRGYALSTSIPTIKRIKLDHFTTFTGSSEQAAYFVQIPIMLPNLQFINVINDSYFQSYTFETDYMAIAAHFGIINRRMLEMNIHPSISLCLANQNNIGDSIASTVPADIIGSDCSQHFTIISCLTLKVVYHLPPAETAETHLTYDLLVDYTLSWLNLFQDLRYLTLLVKCNRPIDDSVQSYIVSLIKARFPKMVSVNLVNLTVEPDKQHYHWSNAHSDWGRGTYDIPTTLEYERKSRELCVCSHF